MPTAYDESKLQEAWSFWGILAILLLAFAVRIYALEAVPPFIPGEEADEGIAVREILAGRVSNLFSLGRQNQPQISFLPRVWGMLTYGDDLWGLRFGSVIVGLVSVGLAFVLARDLFGLLPALWVGTFHALLPAHVHFSRIGTINLQGVVVTQLVLLTLVKALRKPTAASFAFLGIALALPFYSYTAARMVWPAFLIALVYLRVVHRDQLRASLGHLGATFLAFCIVAMPMVLFYLQQPRTFTSRVGDVFLFSPQNQEALAQQGGLFSLLAYQTLRVVTGLAYAEDTSPVYNTTNGLLGPLLTPLAVLGLILTVKGAKELGKGLLLIWFVVGFVLGGILTTGQPFAPRLMVLVPILLLFIALAIVSIGRHLSLVLRLAATAGFLLLFLYDAFIGYFMAYGQREHASQRPHTELARAIAELQDHYPIAVVGLPHYSATTPIVRFVAPQAQAWDVSPAATFPGWRLTRDTAFIIFRSHQQKEQALLASGVKVEALPFPSRYFRVWVVRAEVPSG